MDGKTDNNNNSVGIQKAAGIKLTHDYNIVEYAHNFFFIATTYKW